VYSKARETEEGKTEPHSYEGLTLVFEKADGKFRIGVAGEKSLESKDLAKLLKEVNPKKPGDPIRKNLAPAKPVKVGDSWAVPAKEIAESLEEETIDPAKSDAKIRLAKVYEKGTSKFGVFEVVMKLAITEADAEGIKIAFASPAVMEAKITYDLAIDGSTTESRVVGTVSVKGDGVVTIGERKIRAVVDVKDSNSEEETAEVYDIRGRTVPKVRFLADPSEWTEFKPKDAAFIVKFPGAPTESTSKEESYTITTYAAEIESRTIRYSVLVTAPRDSSTIDAKQALKGAAAAFKNPKSLKEIEVNGFPGIEVTYEMEANGVQFDFAQRVVIVNGRFFEAATRATRGKMAETAKFFESFRILEKPKKNDD
jgi:hypothetical protein